MNNMIIERAREIVSEWDALPKNERPMFYRLFGKKIRQKLDNAVQA